MINKIETAIIQWHCMVCVADSAAIAIIDKNESIPTLATAQVLSLFGLNSEILTHNELEKADLPNESVILLMENQIRTTLTKLRRQKWAGAVVILSSIPYQDLYQKYSYILQYGGQSKKKDDHLLKYGKPNNDSWEKPYHISDLLIKLSQLEPLRKGTLNLLTENFEKANLKSQEAIEQLNQDIKELSQFTAKSSELQQQLNQIEQQFEQLFSPLSKHTKIILEDYGEANISTHFRNVIREIQSTDKLLAQKTNTLQEIITILSKQMQDLGEDLEMFSN